MVLGEGVLVVDRIDQSLVRGVQQGHAGRLVDAAALGLDDPVLDLVRHAHAVAAADGVRLHHEVDGGGELLAVDRHRAALLEADGDVLGGDLHRRVPEPHTHDRLDGLDTRVQVLEGLGLVRGAPDVGVGGVRLLRAVAVGQVVGEEPLGHFLAAAELGHEGGVQPGLVDPQMRVGQQAVAVEPLDVVALERRAVAPDLHVVLEHRPHQEGARDGAAERRGVEVGAPTRADVERPAGERGQTLFDQRCAAVDQARDLGTVGLRAAGHRGDVGLVVLTDVGGVGARDGASVAHPCDRDRGVESAGEGDADTLAGGEGSENLRHRKSMHW